MVAQQILRGVVPGEGLQELSGGPFCGGVGGHSEMHRRYAVMAENHEGEQELERDGGYDEEVQGDQVLNVILEKGPPRLGGGFRCRTTYLATVA